MKQILLRIVQLKKDKTLGKWSSNNKENNVFKDGIGV